MREGVKEEGGHEESLQTGVLDTSNQVLLYLDTQLLTRLTAKYPDIRQRKNVTILTKPSELVWFVSALKEIFEEEGLELPA